MSTLISNFKTSKFAVCSFLALLFGLYIVKPGFLFEDQGKRRQFGLGYTRDHEKKTLFDMTVITVFLSLICGIVL